VKKREEKRKMIRILIVDHKTTALELGRNLSSVECQVIAAETCSEALTLLKMGEEVDIVIIGIKLPSGYGVDLLRKLKVLYPTVEIIMLVGHGSVDAAVKSMKLGAYDCVTKPVNISELTTSVCKAYKAKCLRKSKMSDNESESMDHEFVGESKQTREIKKLISLVGPSRAPVLILGETGTGKEVVARAVHMASDRSSGPFVTVNASALPENILESELFGYKKGAFTGAQSDKAGLLDIADGGTFFADEVGDMDLAIQSKLLRVIETGTFRKLGDTRERKVNVRLVSATNKDLEQEVKGKTFRADLFYRLSTFIIHVPPLRERKEDIPFLIDYFLRRISRGKAPIRISAEVLGTLIDYPWPGNVRELANTLERACLFTVGGREIQADMLHPDILNSKFIQAFAKRGKEKDKSIILLDVEKKHIEQVLEAAGGNKVWAARALGISRTKLYSRLRDM
jgi:two-component system, NtrC family, response regulator AtoC